MEEPSLHVGLAVGGKMEETPKLKEGSSVFGTGEKTHMSLHGNPHSQ